METLTRCLRPCTAPVDAGLWSISFCPLTYENSSTSYIENKRQSAKGNLNYPLFLKAHIHGSLPFLQGITAYESKITTNLTKKWTYGLMITSPCGRKAAKETPISS